ncbi:MAG: AI-2E family transporter [Firmicutes bacterium]|nr:AI-2E family transporter [Bacillota bacterium]
MPLKKLLFIILIIPLLGYVLYLSRAIIGPFITAFFLAYAINPLVEFLQKKGARREYAILTVYVILIVLIALVLGSILPRLIDDLTKVIKKMPVIFEEFEKLGGSLNRFYWRLPLNLKPIVGEVIKRMEIILRDTLIQLAETTVDLLSKAALFILVPVLAYYINRDYPRLKQKSYCWLTDHLGNHWTRTFLKVDSVLKIYIRGQLLLTVIVGLLIGIGLSLLGLEAAFLLGIVAGVLNLIPYFGPVLGAIPAGLLALLHSPWSVLYVIILFVIVNQLEVLFLAPRIIGDSLRMHPIAVVYLILTGSKIGGLFGMVFAAPLGAILIIFLKSIYEIAFGIENNEPISEKLNFNHPELD